jgi:hypothetical protein
MAPQSESRSRTTGQGFQGFLSAILADRERFFTEVVNKERLGQKLRYSVLTLLALTAFYGVIVGCYSGAAQAVSAAVKLPFLFTVTFLICFLALFVVQILVGSRLEFLQVVVLVTGSLALTAILLAAFAPISAFFLITGSNYYFLILLHIVIVLVSGLFGMYALHEGLQLVCEKHSVYPKKAMTIVKVWAIIFAFVGIQMAWNLRPFLGDREQPFRVFRQYEGNFYAAIIYSINKLFEGKEGASGDRPAKEQTINLEELLPRHSDSTSTRVEP